MTIVTVVTIKLTAGAVSKIPSQSSQPSRGVQRESLLPEGRKGAFGLPKVLLRYFRESNKGKATFIYKEDYEKNNKRDGG